MKTIKELKPALRVILAIIAFFIGVIIALFGWHLLHEEGLTNAELINIALNDTRVKEEIGNWSYEIGEIEYGEYEERNGELKIKGNFPVVPIHLRNKNETGVTLLVFINQEDETVIAIGYNYRRNSWTEFNLIT